MDDQIFGCSSHALALGRGNGDTIPIERFLAGDGRRAPRSKRDARQRSDAEEIEPLLSIKEAAAKFGIPRRRIDDAINGGQLAFYPIGEKARKVKPSDVQTWIESKRSRILRTTIGEEDEA